MINLDLKTRFRNKAFIVSLISAFVLLLQQLGLGKYIPADYVGIENSMLTILCMFGIVIDPSTKGISDNAENEIQENSNDINTSVSDNSNSDNSASAKIVVDNPDNVQEIGAIVNSTSSVKPQ